MDLTNNQMTPVVEKLMTSPISDKMTCECGNDKTKICSACPKARIAKFAVKQGLDPNRYVTVATTTPDSERQRKLRIRNIREHLHNILGRKPSRKEVNDLIQLQGRKIFDLEQAERERVVPPVEEVVEKIAKAAITKAVKDSSL
jgi:hypothetical protein